MEAGVSAQKDNLLQCSPSRGIGKVDRQRATRSRERYTPRVSITSDGVHICTQLFSCVLVRVSHPVRTDSGNLLNPCFCAGAAEHACHRSERPFRVVPGLEHANSESREQTTSPASSKDMMAVFTCTKCGEDNPLHLIAPAKPHQQGS